MIFLDTNVVSESARPRPEPKVVEWVNANDSELALSTVALAELAFGIERTREAERAKRLTGFIQLTLQRFSRRIFPFDKESALIYGRVMGESSRNGRPISVPDGMIAAVAIRNGAALATRNIADFQGLGVELIDPWD